VKLIFEKCLSINLQIPSISVENQSENDGESGVLHGGENESGESNRD
jgi:hypothetical protein